jgi:RNA polymerase sigma-70 factor (ECF subfamily)
MTEPSPGFEASDLDRRSAWMRRLARGLLGDRAAADDVVQEAWAKLGAARGRAGYLAAVVRSLARRRQRSEWRRLARERDAARGEALPSADEIAARSELARLLAEAVERLEEPYRTTIVLRYYDDLCSAEIARQAGIPAATVRVRLKRGLDCLRTRLDESGGGRERWVSALLPLARGSTNALGASVTMLIAMKLALASLLVVSALVLAWRAVSSGAPAERGTQGGLEGARAQVAAGPELLGQADATRREALVASSHGSRAVLAAVETPQSGLVHARALDEAGAPIPHAWLRLRQAPETTVSGDASGDLALAVEPGELERLASPDGSRIVMIEIGARGHRTRLLRPSLPDGAGSLELGEVTLPPGGVLHGRVLDEAGRGIPGALVVFGMPVLDEPGALPAYRGPPDLETDPWDGRDPAVVGTSGPGGEFRLDGLGAGFGTAWARTATSLWASSEPIGMRAGEELRGIELVLRDSPAETISGRVIDPDGRPLPWLRLTFARSEAPDGWSELTTDARGEFHFASADGATQDIGARSPSWEWQDLEHHGVAPGTHQLVLAFERSRWLWVAVQDQRGAKVRNGRVLGLPADGPLQSPLPRCESPLDEHGQARLRRPDLPLRVRVEAPGFRDRIVGPIDPALFPEGPECPERLTVTLEPAPALVGRVLRENGRPAAGARVSLHRGAGEDSGTLAPGATGPAGRWRLTHQGWSGDRDAFVYELSVEPLARVTADEQGRFRLPLPGADTKAAGEDEDRDTGEALSSLGYAGDPARSVASAKPEATWYVHAAVEGAATTTSGPHRFDPSRDFELELSLPPGGSVAGKLVLEDGRSGAGWTAYASDGLAEVAEAPVRPDGTFELDGLHAGGWQIRLFEPGRRYLGGGRLRTERVPVPDVQVIAEEQVSYEHRTRASASARLRGRLSLDGAPPGAWRVIVCTATPQYAITSHETTLDPDGAFELRIEPGLATTLLILGLENGAELTLSSKLTILPGTNEWSFELETARLEGTIAPQPSSGLPFGNRPTYVCQRGDVVIRASWTPAEDGRFGPLRVPAGPGFLRGPQRSFDEPAPVWAELDLEPGESRRVQLPQR